MAHPYQSLTRDRNRRLAGHNTERSSPVSWIVAIGFIFILGCVLFPLFQKLTGIGQ